MASETLVYKSLNGLFKSISLNLSLTNKSWEVQEMAYNPKRVFMFGAFGFLAAVLVIAAVSTTSIFPPSLTPPKAGTLIIEITDKPADLRHLNLTIDGFEVRWENESWVEVPVIGGNVSFDLLQLQNRSIDAAIGELPLGNYTMIRMHIVQGSAYTNATLTNGTVISIRVPSGKIKVITPTFEIKGGENTTILLDLQVDTVHLANNPQHNLAPAMKIDVTVL